MVKLNNIEAVRKNLHQLYESIDVPAVMDVLEKEPKQEESSDTLDARKKAASGTLNLVVVRAQGLLACDSNGKSDPYAIIKVNKKIVARTRTIESKSEDGGGRNKEKIRLTIVAPLL